MSELLSKENFFININKSCCVTGHRDLEENFDKKNLENLFLSLIENGYENFLIGMALGFDSLCFKILENIRKNKDIKLYACIPCENQAERFSFFNKNEYDKMVKSADYRIVLEKSYTNYCMQNRNKFMVDNSSLLIAYIRKTYGGSVNTYNYAVRKNVNVIKV